MSTPDASAGSGSGSYGTGSQTFSAAQLSYVRRKRKLPEEQEMGELNIVPYLDIMVNLIMFLLVTQATMVSLGVIDVTAPSYAIAGASPGGEIAKGADLKLTIGVSVDGYYIAAKGGVLGEETTGELTEDGVTKRAPTIPLRPDGKHDYAALTRNLRAIKTSFPDASAVYIAADQGIPYEVIVKTLDHSREDSAGELFPAVAFSRLR
jgi:biopolymer transport protein TolR